MKESTVANRKSKAPPPTVERATVPIASLEAAAYNPRKLSAKARKGLRESLTRFGVVQEVVVNRRADGTLRIVGGHQRIDVLRESGATEVPVSIVTLDDEAEKALNLALNNPGIAGEFDGDGLAALLAEIKTNDDALFAALNLDDLFANAITTPDFQPISDPSGRLDEKKLVCCPECGHNFDPHA